MTIAEALENIEKLRPGSYDEHDKIHWLSNLDGRIQEDIINRHEGPGRSWGGYTDQTPRDTVLLAPDRYSDMYVWYMARHIDMADGEYLDANNDNQEFKALYDDFEAWYIRTHVPKGPQIHFF